MGAMSHKNTYYGYSVAHPSPQLHAHEAGKHALICWRVRQFVVSRLPANVVWLGRSQDLRAHRVPGDQLRLPAGPLTLIGDHEGPAAVHPGADSPRAALPLPESPLGFPAMLPPRSCDGCPTAPTSAASPTPAQGPGPDPGPVLGPRPRLHGTRHDPRRHQARKRHPDQGKHQSRGHYQNKLSGIGTRSHKTVLRQPGARPALAGTLVNRENTSWTARRGTAIRCQPPTRHPPALFG
jgi:hypothetical protein